MLYDLSLHMGYTYDTPAHGARHIIRILPLSIPGRQRLVAGSIDVLPTPEERAVALGHRGEILAADAHLPTVRPVDAADQVEQRALAAAAATEQRDEFAAPKLDGRVLQDHAATVERFYR